MVYLDSSSLLKLLWLEPESEGVRNRVAVEEHVIETEPFRFHDLGATLLKTALRQHRAAGTPHCRSLDRLHLAAMEELRVRRLITSDASQAAVARAIGFEVLMPGVP